MKKMMLGAVVVSALALVGCASGPNQAVGTAAGGVAGYAVGTALGGGSAGRALGAVTGAVIGSSVGSSMDQQQRQAQVPQPQPEVIYRERVIVRECYWVREYDRYYGTMRERRICR
jgi:osmotically inducible lipoprotein OsmB